MKLEQSFTVEAPLEQVWAALVDVERIAPCLPGAEITGKDDDGAYRGTFSVKLGPTTAAYNGSLRMESVDDDAHVATMSARGTDKRGQGGANATIISKLVEENGATRVDVDTDFTITGKLARFGRGGMIQDVSKRLMRDFASCLQATLTTGTDTPTQAAAAPAVAGEPVTTQAAPPPAPAASAAGDPEPTHPAPGATPRSAPTSAPQGGSVPPPGAPPAPPRPAPAKPVNGLKLMLSILWERLQGLFARRRK